MLKPDVADIEFFFDPVCPFAWQTSRWMRRVAEHRSFTVDWRFISLRVLNEGRDYERDFPAGYVDGHTRGLELLRVAAATREAGGNGAVGALYAAYGAVLWDSPDGLTAPLRTRGDRASIEAVLAGLGLDPALAAAADDERHDVAIRAETGEATGRVGDDVGTPIVTYLPPDGLSFFGPVLSRLPEPDEAVAVWDAVTALATVAGFAELKRSLRDPLDLAAFADR